MRALVTGGGGFLGGAVVRALLERGDTVRSFHRGEYEDLARLGVEQSRGDLADAEAVARAVAGVDVVFHVAAKAGVWGPAREYESANVAGTGNVIDACRRHGVGRLVFTSSPSVVFAGADQEGVDASAPYPRRHLAHYPRTKAEAERRVLAADGPDLATVALRPHLVWGPRDNHLVPRIIARGRAGRLRRVGTRPCPVDSTYVEDGASAHLAAADRLAPGAPCAGRAYFVSQGEPLPVFDLVDRILATAGLDPVRRTVSPAVAYGAGAALEALWSLLRLGGEPPMTRFVARQLSTAHWFDLSATQRDLCWAPRFTVDEGMERLAAWVREAGL